MRITRLRLHDFKRHAELDLEPHNGLTVVRGPNESGKSTVQRALEVSLFRRATSSAQDLGDVRHWAAPERDPAVELEFEDDGVKGRLSKRFAGAKGTVELVLDGQTITDQGAVEEQVLRLTGLPSEKFYRATASIHHQELDGLDHDENTLRDRLQQSMSGADRGTFAARRKLEEAIRRYRSEGAKNPGYVKSARADVERLTAELAAGEAALSELERDRQALVEAREARAKLDEQLDQYRQALDASERAVKLAERADAAAERYELYKRAEELRSQISALDAAHPSALPLAELRAGIERARDLEYRLSELRAEIAAEPEVGYVESVETTPRWKPFAIGAAVLAGLAVVGLVGGLVIGEMLIGLVLAAGLGVAAGVLAFLAFRGQQTKTEVEGQIELRDVDIARRLRGRADRTEQLRDLERGRDEVLVGLGQVDLAAAEALLQAETDHTARIDNVRAELRGLLPKASPEESFATARDEAAAEVDECRHALAGMGPIGSDPTRSQQTFRGAVDRAVTEREGALTTEAQARTRVDANSIDAEIVAGQAEALAAAETRLASVQRRLGVYETVLATLEEAERSTMKEAARFLEAGMATDVELVTDGRYRRLRVDETTLSFSVYSVEAGEWIDVRSLSRGTLDQLYLCARLGIVRQVTQPATPPIVLDDPFVTFDDDRARRALELLKRVAADYQVILLTCSKRYDDLADKVIELPRPEQRDDGTDERPAAVTAPAVAPAPEPVAVPADPVAGAPLELGLPFEPAEPEPTEQNGSSPAHQPAGLPANER